MGALIVLIIAGICVYFIIKKSIDKETGNRLILLIKYLSIFLGLIVGLVLLIMLTGN